MKRILFIVSLFFFIGCDAKKEQKVEITPKANFYKQSEMAALMLLMYETNAQNKQLILEGKQPKEFPEEFLKIHSAQLTDPTDRTADFKTFSDFYLENMKLVFEPTQESLVNKHNTTVNSCIACHQTTCVGPIPKIKKLLIQ